jgi:prophage regulatory protein
MVDFVLRRGEVERATGFKTSSLYEEMKQGRFPKPIKIAARSVGWLSSEIAEWQKTRKAARDSTTV